MRKTLSYARRTEEIRAVRTTTDDWQIVLPPDRWSMVLVSGLVIMALLAAFFVGFAIWPYGVGLLVGVEGFERESAKTRLLMLAVGFLVGLAFAHQFWANRRPVLISITKGSLEATIPSWFRIRSRRIDISSTSFAYIENSDGSDFLTISRDGGATSGTLLESEVLDR